MNSYSYLCKNDIIGGNKFMKNISGSPVVGDNFLNRNYEKKYCINRLKESNSLSILGIRRTGKSSLLKEVARLIKKDNYFPIELDCQSYSKPSELFLGILKQLPKDTLEKFTEQLKKLKSIPQKILDVLNVESIKGYGVDIKFDEKVRDYWIPISNSIEKIILTSDKKIILFLDELPYFFENLLDQKNNENFSETQVKQILATLRSWRNEGIQMAICGSLNINNFLESYSISRKLLAGLTSVEVKPFSNDEAKSLLKNLAKSHNINWLDEKIKNKILKLIQDNIPFFIQYFFAFLMIEKKCNEEKLQEIFDLKVYPGLIKEFIYQFEERLGNYSEDVQKQVDIVLDYIAQKGSGSFTDIKNKSTTRIELKTFLKLNSDEFLKPDRGEKYSFSLNILKNWWIEKRGLKI